MLDKKSELKLAGVHSDLVEVVQRAKTLSSVPFIVTEGRRTLQRQKELVAQGKSQTLNSRHLSGFAVDVAAVVDGDISWEFENYLSIADAMLKASEELDTPVIWGAAWGRVLFEYETAEDAHEEYKDERKKLGKKPFIDGPHFELWSEVY